MTQPVDAPAGASIAPYIVAYTREALHGLSLRAALEPTPFALQAIYTDTGELPRTLCRQPALLLYDALQDQAFHQLRGLRPRLPGVRVVVLLAQFSSTQVPPLRELGVEGVMRRGANAGELVDCLHHVWNGGQWTDAAFEAVAPALRRNRLTAREAELVRLVAAGHPNREISTRLGITEGTVKGNLSKLYRKLGLAGRHDLATHGESFLPPGRTEPAATSAPE